MGLENNHFIPNIENEATPESPETRNRKNFRVAVFCSATIENDEEKNATKFGEALAKSIVGEGQHTIVLGGYNVGTVEKIKNAALEKTEEINRDDLKPIGIPLEDNTTIRHQPFHDTPIEPATDRYDRLEKLAEKSAAIVVLEGRMGAFVEATAALHFEKEKEKPIIFVDHSYDVSELKKGTNEKDLKHLLSNNKLAIDDLRNVYLLNDEKEQVNVANSIIEAYYKKSVKKDLSLEDKTLLEKYNFATIWKKDPARFIEKSNKFNKSVNIINTKKD